MLVQIGQDMVTTEQQIRAHSSQTRRTVELQRLVPEYELTQEKNLCKRLSITTDARKLIKTVDMKSVQELRFVTKAEKPVEDTLAAITMILKSPTADITWQEGAKRQLANLDRFIEETQLFDKTSLTEEHINLISAIIDNVQVENASLNLTSYYNAILTFYKWVKRISQYHTLLLKKVRPIRQKYKEIEEDVLGQDQKLILLDSIRSRLKDLLQNFEEATVDKKDQEETVAMKENQLKTASELNQILSREVERTSRIFETSVERQSTLNVYLKNVHQSSFSTVFKQIRFKGQHNIVISKDAFIDLIYLGARLQHYDCLLEGNVSLSNLLYKNSNNYIREIIGEELTVVCGSTLIQSISVYQQIFEQSTFTLQWTRNFPQITLNLMKNLIEMTFSTHSPLVTKLLNELFQQISSKSTIKLNEYQFEIQVNLIFNCFYQINIQK
ncbi:unnamed protein product [Adineta steineri]|uniref:Uncharacterized protein n=1 Tax=Adineta steineri TaxID=433720 RepID=A0A819F4I0_9BILA|nr:unnamed protein product [Adineta steineri]